MIKNNTYQEFRENQKTFNSSDGRIRYIDEGRGEVILLLHGVPTSSWLYRNMIDELVTSGYRVIAPDMLGFGNSDNPKGYDIYSSERHSKRIIELMNSLNIDHWSHVMHDAGGFWTWELIKNNPDRITKLIILNTLIFNEGFHPPVRMREGFLAKFILSLYRNKIFSKILLNQLFKGGLKLKKLTPSEFEGYSIPLLEGRTNAMYYFFTQTSQPFPEHENTLRSLNIPVAVIWGKDDKILKLDPQKEKVMDALNITPDNIHVLNGSHFIQEEFPQQINSIIMKFIG